MTFVLQVVQKGRELIGLDAARRRSGHWVFWHKVLWEDDGGQSGEESYQDGMPGKNGEMAESAWGRSERRYQWLVERVESDRRMGAGGGENAEENDHL